MHSLYNKEEVNKRPRAVLTASLKGSDCRKVSKKAFMFMKILVSKL
jgi:hypothetical protein